MHRETPVWGVVKDAVRPGSCPSGRTTRQTPDALRPRSGAGNGNAVWGLMKDAVRPGCNSAEGRTRGTAVREVKSGTQCGHRLRYQPPARRKLRCNGKRPVSRRCRRTGACETCGAAANAVQQLRRSSVGKRPEPLYARPQGEDREAYQPLRQGDSMGEGIRDAVLFLSATSLRTIMRPELGCHLGFGVPAGAKRRTTHAPAMVGTKRR